MARRAIASQSLRVRIPPVGFCGELTTSIRVRGVISLASSSTSARKSFSWRSGSETALAPMNSTSDR